MIHYLLTNFIYLFACVDKNITVGPSLLPAKKYCDITGLPAKYVDPRLKLYYADSKTYQFICTLSEDNVKQYLAIRSAAPL